MIQSAYPAKTVLQTPFQLTVTSPFQYTKNCSFSKVTFPIKASTATALIVTISCQTTAVVQYLARRVHKTSSSHLTPPVAYFVTFPARTATAPMPI